MAERPKAPVLKTGVGQPTGGSNPSPSAKKNYIEYSLKIGESDKIQEAGFYPVVRQSHGEVPEWSNGAAC
jgi:hypothetical protein